MKLILALGILVLAVLLPVDRSIAQPEPDGGECDSLTEYADVQNCVEDVCDQAGDDSGACQRAQGECEPGSNAGQSDDQESQDDDSGSQGDDSDTQDDDSDSDSQGDDSGTRADEQSQPNETSDGTTCVTCVYRPMLGSNTLSPDVENSDLWDHLGGATKDLLNVLGLGLPTIPVVFHGEPQWWQDQIRAGHCDLADIPPTSCGLDGNDDDVAGQIWNEGRHGPRPVTEDQGILPDACVGLFPTSHYDIGYSTAGFADVEDRLNGNLSNLFFGIGKGAIQIAFKFTNYAYDFPLWERLGTQAENAWLDYDDQIAGPLRLEQVAWLALVGYLALLAVRGRLALAGSEFVVAVLMLALFTALLANREGYMQGASHTIDEVSASILRIGCGDRDGDGRNDAYVTDQRERQLDRTLRRDQADMGENPTTVDPCENRGLRRRQWRLHTLFVDEPYRYINWNWDDEFQRMCSTYVGDILSTGPHGTDDWPRLYLQQNRQRGDRCYDAAVWNADATVERTFEALLAGAMALGLALVIATMALSILIAKLVVAALFALSPIPAALAVLPSGGRRLATSWMTTLLQAIVVAIGMSLLLSLLMIGIEAVAVAPVNAGLDLTERWILLIAVMIMVAAGRRRFLATLQGISSQISDRLARPQLLEPGGGLGGGFGGRGRPSHPSIFGTPRVPSEQLTLATTGLTAATGAGALALSATRVGLKGATAPVRGAKAVLVARKTANRAGDNLAAQLPLGRTMDRAKGKRRGGLLGRLGTPYEEPASVLPPRWQRVLWHHVGQEARARRLDALRVPWFLGGRIGPSIAKGLDATAGAFVRAAWRTVTIPDPRKFPRPDITFHGQWRQKRRFFKGLAHDVYATPDFEATVKRARTYYKKKKQQPKPPPQPQPRQPQPQPRQPNNRQPNNWQQKRRRKRKKRR